MINLNVETLPATSLGAGLGTIHVRGNPLLRSLSGHAVGKLSKLWSAIFTGNGIQAIPTEIGQLSMLTSFDFSSNHLTVLPTEMGRLAKLESLRASANRIRTLPHEFAELSQLLTVELAANRMTSVPFDVVRRWRHLVLLDLEGNNISAASWGTWPWRPLSEESKGLAETDPRLQWSAGLREEDEREETFGGFDGSFDNMVNEVKALEERVGVYVGVGYKGLARTEGTTATMKLLILTGSNDYPFATLAMSASAAAGWGVARRAVWEATLDPFDTEEEKADYPGAKKANAAGSSMGSSTTSTTYEWGVGHMNGGGGGTVVRGGVSGGGGVADDGGVGSELREDTWAGTFVVSMIPSCAAGCRLLDVWKTPYPIDSANNGLCDLMCRTRECGFDMGDCV